MSVPPEIFGEDYLYFYADVLGARRSDADAELVARLLSLGPGTRVLDVPCGEGRIAGRLARLGCEVVGIDASQRFLELAAERWAGITFRHGDMRDLDFESEFDAVVNWFSSFGYFDRETNDAVLRAFARALRPGGQLLLEVHNPGRLERLVQLAGGSSASVLERDGDLIADRVTYDPDEGFSRTERFIVRDGHVRRLEFRLEQIPAEQLVQRLGDAGFADVRLFGQGGVEFEPEGRRLIALARR
jgi:SAM-dependent methyltransferase